MVNLTSGPYARVTRKLKKNNAADMSFRIAVTPRISETFDGLVAKRL
jgi:hypothetical protein